MTAAQSIALFDKRPFFEKALIYGKENGILNATHLEKICRDAPKGMVQIARYFGTEFLRPELEKSRERMVNLVSLYLAQSCAGDLHQAAESLRDNSFLSRSKGGSDMLKALMVMPEDTHFALHGSTVFDDDSIPILDKWTQRSLSDYQMEFARRSTIATIVNAAIWFAQQCGMNESDLRQAGCDAHAVIRTGLLVLRSRKREMPDRLGFQKIIQNLRKSKVSAIALPKNLPEAFIPIAEKMRDSIVRNLSNTLIDKHWSDDYFWIEDLESSIENHTNALSAAWHKTTGGHTDDGALLTLFLCIAVGNPPKLLLTEAAAKTLMRKIQKSGLQTEWASDFIRTNAPHELQEGYLDLWEAFIDESESILCSDAIHADKDALALLRRECNVK
ncbi:MAG: hypothetical protein RIR79_953 [Pseudomonadota bacterium]